MPTSSCSSIATRSITRKAPDRGTAEIIIGKQRNGPIGTVRLTFLGEYTRFENYAGIPLG
jgi:replicative DNA helicase